MTPNFLSVYFCGLLFKRILSKHDYLSHENKGRLFLGSTKMIKYKVEFQGGKEREMLIREVGLSEIPLSGNPGKPA